MNKALLNIQTEEAHTPNSGFKKLAVQWLDEVRFFNQTFVHVDSVLRNRQLLKPAKRYATFNQLLSKRPTMKTEFKTIIPVLPSADIERDVTWYKEKLGFEIYFHDDMYAVIYRENICIHLQWHADTVDDPLLAGSVVRIYMQNISSLFSELVEHKIVENSALKLKTPWNTNEFGFYDLTGNAIFVMEDAE